jgi:hypothetical protein
MDFIEERVKLFEVGWISRYKPRRIPVNVWPAVRKVELFLLRVFFLFIVWVLFNYQVIVR